MNMLRSHLRYTKATHVALKFQQIEILLILKQIDPSRIEKRHKSPASKSPQAPATHFPKHTTAPEIAQFANFVQTRPHHNQMPPINLGLKLFNSPTYPQKLLSTVRKQMDRNAP
jgi:hypothetical protein